MTTPSGGYSLDGDRLDRVSSLLDGLYERAEIPPSQQRVFVALQWVAYTLPLLIVAFLLADVGIGEAQQSLAYHLFGAAVRDGLLWLSTLVYPLALVLVVCVALNSPLVGKAWRQYRLARRLALLGFVERLWARSSSAGRRRPWGWLVLAAPVALLGLALVAEVVRLVRRGDGPPFRDKVFVYFVSFGVALMAFVLERVLRRLRTRLEYFRQLLDLRQELGRRKEGGTTGDVPADTARKLAALETLTTLEDRAAAMREKGARRAGYAVSWQARAREELRSLGPRDRVSVQDTILELAREPQPEAAVRLADRNAWRIPVPGSDLELVYAVDRSARRIEVLTLRPHGER